MNAFHKSITAAALVVIGAVGCSSDANTGSGSLLDPPAAGQGLQIKMTSML